MPHGKELGVMYRLRVELGMSIALEMHPSLGVIVVLN